MRMKKLFLLFMFSVVLMSPSLGLAQAGTTGGPTPGLSLPDCNLPFSFTVAASSASFDNRTTECSSWHLMYYADGCTVTSIQPQFAPDNSGVAGSFSIFAATQVFGTIPLTSNTESQVTFSGFHPWVNVRLVTATNCTLVAGRMIGWKAQGSSEATAAANPSQGTTAEGTTTVGFPQQVGGKFETTPIVLTNGQQGVLQQDANQDLLTVISPSTLAAVAIVPVASAAVENGHVLKASAGNLYGLVVTSTVNGLVMIFNSTTVPGNGAVTPLYCLRLTPDSGGAGTFGINFLPGPPASFSTGISWAMSTGTNCANLTLSATAWGTGLAK